ncbi:ATP-grasp domain-containing protein [Nesterenkonia populi]
MSVVQVGIVVTDRYRPDDEDNDTGPLIRALEERGVSAEPVVWHRWPADAEDAARFGLLVLRSPWDYPQREQEFRRWLQQAQEHVTVLNPPGLVTWNLDKLYLRELEERGIALVPTEWVTDASELDAALARRGSDWAVVKPSVSAGAEDTELLRADSPAAKSLGERILGLGRTVMIQPEIPELSEGMEKALYFIDGSHTHTVAKGALLARGGGFRGGQYLENPQPVTASEEETAFGAEVMRAVETATGGEAPLYGRVDMVSSAEHGIVLLEVELFEPALNLHRVPDAARSLAEAIADRF